MLISKYPTWSDEELFQTVRLIACALNVKIYTVEWTPVLLNNDFLKVGMGVNWWGKVPKFLDRLVPAPLRPFIVPMRMHSLLPDQITVKDCKTNSIVRTYRTAQTTFGGSQSFMDSNGINNILFTFGTSYPGALVLNNYPQFLTHFKHR
ncbi:hypothetical protein HDU96_010920, partial [Phlyctochytrium bullatum]